jgi:hypothetical protein
MEYVLMVATVLGVGFIVYRLSMAGADELDRIQTEVASSGTPSDAGFGAVPSAPPVESSAPRSADPGTGYLTVSRAKTTWHVRLAGVLGLIVLIVVLGVALAFLMFQGGMLLFRAISQAVAV